MRTSVRRGPQAHRNENVFDFPGSDRQARRRKLGEDARIGIARKAVASAIEQDDRIPSRCIHSRQNILKKYLLQYTNSQIFEATGVLAFWIGIDKTRKKIRSTNKTLVASKRDFVDLGYFEIVLKGIKGRGYSDLWRIELPTEPELTDEERSACIVAAKKLGWKPPPENVPSGAGKRSLRPDKTFPGETRPPEGTR